MLTDISIDQVRCQIDVRRGFRSKSFCLHAVAALSIAVLTAGRASAQTGNFLEEMPPGTEIVTTNSCKLTIPTEMVPDYFTDRTKWRTWKPKWEGRCFHGKALGYGTLSMVSPELVNGRQPRIELTGTTTDGSFLGLALHQDIYASAQQTVVSRRIYYFATGGIKRYASVQSELLKTEITPEQVRLPVKALDFVDPGEAVANGQHIFMHFLEGHVAMQAYSCQKPAAAGEQPGPYCMPNEVGERFRIVVIPDEKGAYIKQRIETLDNAERYKAEAARQLAEIFTQFNRLISGHEWVIGRILQGSVQRADAQEKDEAEARERAEKIELANRAEALKQAARVSEVMEKGNAGQLLAIADELKERGEVDAARQVLRRALTKYPDHPLAAEAARTLRELRSGSDSDNGPGGSAVNIQAAGPAIRNAPNAGAGNATTGSGDCEARIAAHEMEIVRATNLPYPPGATPPLKRVMWATSERIQLLRRHCPASPHYQAMIDGLQRAYDQAELACKAVVTNKSACMPSRVGD